MNRDDINNIIEEIENEKKQDGSIIFRSMVNQPDFLVVNSNDRNNDSSTTSFSDFSINLPRPILQAQSIQLVSCTIPTCTQNIPDNACVFWYYKLSAYRGVLPCINNLHCVRLLPSYYKPELILDSDNYGFNETFHDYEELAGQLNKSCQRDFAYDGWISDNSSTKNKFMPLFIENDISITFNEQLNKFQMTGLQSNTVPFISEWAFNVNYDVENFVMFNNVIYISNEPNINISPGTSSDWVIFESSNNFFWNRYLITGPQDKNVIALQNSLQRPWEDNYLFIYNEIVTYNGITYTNTKDQSINEIPGNLNSPWIIQGNSVEMGLNKFTKEYDFVYSLILDIPGQPFIDTPKRLLNSILGFNWNGIFKIEDFGFVTLFLVVATIPSTVLLLNKVRPIPNYLSVLNLGLTNNQIRPPFSTDSSTFTADGYCNLVYSQTLQLYGNIVQGSTLNSTTSTGLLGSVMLDAKNLGVSFFQESFSSPLSIYGADIYTMTFQIKDDYNEPYIMGNNAVVILVLKITYK